MREAKMTYVQLLKKTLEQELEINKLLEEKKSYKELLIKKQLLENTNQKNYNTLLDFNDSIILVMDKSMNAFYRSSSTARVTGWKDEQYLDNHLIDYIHPEYITYVKKMTQKSLEHPKIPIRIILKIKHQNGAYIWVEGFVINRIEDENVKGIIVNLRDVTNRINIEKKNVKANRLYQFISQISQMIIRAKSKQTLFNEACSIAVNVGQFKMAWIGLINEKTGIIEHQMIAGEDNGYVKTIQNLFTGDSPRCSAIKEEKFIVVNDIATDENMDKWRDEALNRGFNSLMIVPIKRYEKAIGVFCFYSSDKNFFDAEEIALLDDATSDVGFALEIFEKEKLRKKALKEVTESQNRYHILTEISPVGIFRTNETGYTTYVNPRWTEISGLPYEKALGNGWLDAVHEEDRISLQKGWESATKQNEISYSEYRFVRPDGAIIWVMGQAIPEKNEANEIVGYVGTTTNITERKRVEDDFKKSYQKLESIIDSIPDLLIEIDLEGRIYNYHSHRDDILSHTSKIIIGKIFSEVLPSQAIEAFKIAMVEVSQNGFSIGKQYQLTLSNGNHWFELSIAPMEENQYNEKHFICLSRDITIVKKSEIELQKSKERYRDILNNLDAGIIVQDINENIILNNIKAAELMNLESTISKPNWVFLNEDSTLMPIENYPINQIINGEKTLKNLILGILKPNNNEVGWFLFNVFSVKDNNGKIIEIVSSFIDITEQKQLQNEILKEKKQAESANKAKTDFLANMSHEIRTPLNGIIGFTHLLMESELNRPQKQYMSTINESASSLLNIVNDVLDFSKIESGKFELNLDQVDLLELSQQAIDLFKYQTINKKLKLSLHKSENVPQFILADVVRLKQVLVNLLSNAFKFTEFGEIQLNIVELSATNHQTTLHFSVNDTGIGIKTYNNDKIFDSFVQEDNSTSRKFGGTGLGLSISNQLLSLMGSKLELKSKLGEGSTFFFTITFKKINSNIQKPSIYSKNIKKNEFNEFNNLLNHSILLVEDNKVNMLLAKTLIKKKYPNITLFEAKDGNEAVEIFKTSKIDLILMDLQMPNKNGYEATNEIRNLIKGETTPIIAITAGILAHERENCLNAGMNDYLSKPFVKKDLESILKKWLS